MVSRQLDKLLKEMNFSVKTLAEYANFSPSIISRIRNGRQTPKPSSSTIVKLVNGIIIYCDMHHLHEELIGFLKKNDVDASRENLRSSIKNYLFLSLPERSNISDLSSAESLFPKDLRQNIGKKLTASMLLTNTSNIELSRYLNVDPSYISLLKNGKRLPTANSALCQKLAQFLFAKVKAAGKCTELARLIHGAPCTGFEEDEEEFFFAFRNWLLDLESVKDPAAHFLEELNLFFSSAPEHLPSYEHILDDIRQKYPDSAIQPDFSDSCNCCVGTEGLKTSVIRFLRDVIQTAPAEICLYSDLDMTWMTEDRQFAEIWMALMLKVAGQGTRIKIIHNINRDLSEILSAIRCWMPLYFTNMIEPYYLEFPTNRYFTRTLFLAPGISCVNGSSVRKNTAAAIYNYFTDPRLLTLFCSEFDQLLRDSRPFMHTFISQSPTPEIAKAAALTPMKNIHIAIEETSVTVTKTDAPYLSMTFFHPVFCSAFTSYARHPNAADPPPRHLPIPSNRSFYT